MQRIHIHYMRVQEWWGHILPPIFLVYYAALPFSPPTPGKGLGGMLILMLLSVLTAMTGYFLNDLFDIREDALAGKKNYVAALAPVFRIMFLPLLFLLLFLLLYFNPAKLPVPALYLCASAYLLNTLFFLLYSAPPFRFKGSPYLAPCFDALYSGTLFYLLAYLLPLTFSGNSHAALLLQRPHFLLALTALAAWGFARGLRTYLIHLCHDHDHDALSGLRTLATELGSDRLMRRAQWLFPAELIFLCLFFYTFPAQPLPAYAVCGIFLLYWYLQGRQAEEKEIASLNDLHEVWLPLVLLLLLVFRYPAYWPLLLLHVLFFPYHLYKIYCLIDRLYFYTIFRWIGPLRKKG